jgi:peroxiredoxin Q/BCP
MTTLKVGDVAPDFAVNDQNGQLMTLNSLKGSRVVLFFYPKDNSSGCTIEAKNLRDGMAELAAAGFEVIGVSPDSEKSHQNFITKQELPYRLLADTDHAVATAYGVWGEKSMYGRHYMGIFRTTFVIGTDGRIERVFTKVDTKNHTQQIIESYK